MTKKGNLFSLIKSLSKAEKRHFKLFASTGGTDKVYLRLFEVIDRQEQYDEAAVVKKFEGAPFTKQLHVTKNYLSRLILKSLRNYHSKLSKEAEVSDLLRNIEILFRKELYDNCHYEIQKAKKLAGEYEKYDALQKVLNWERRLLLNRHGPTKRKEEVREILTQEADCLNKIIRHNEYWQLTMGMFDYGFGENDFTEFEANPLVNDPSMANSLQSRILFHHLEYAYGTISAQPEIGEKHILALITMLEEHPHRIKDEPDAYITALNNLIGLLLHSGRHDEIPEVIQKIRNIPEKYALKGHSKVTAKIIARSYNVELEAYRDKARFNEAIALVPEINEFLEKNRHAIPPEYYVAIFYQIAYVYFMLNDLSPALRWTNKILDSHFEEMREDLQTIARMLNLIIHFELGNITVLKYAVDSTRRFLKKKRELQDFEIILLRFFSKISMAHAYEYKNLFGQLHAELFSEGHEKLDANTLDYLDFKSWIEGKMEKRRVGASF